MLPVKSSLRNKALLFLLGYTLALEGSILAFFYYSGRDGIRRQSGREAGVHAALARAAVEKALSDAVAEVDGLRARLLLYPPPVRMGGAPLKFLEELVLAAPKTWAEIRLSDRGSNRTIAVRAMGELGSIYAVSQQRPGVHAGDRCSPEAGQPCLPSLPAGPAGELVRVVAPLDAAQTRTLVADVYLEALLDPAARLAAPPHVSLLASTRRGLILHAGQPHLLRTYLPETETDAVAVRREEIDRLEVVLIAKKDQTAELDELTANLLRIAFFTGILTVLAFTGVWALTGRMVASLRHVTEVADSVAAGDFSRRITLRRSDELGVLIDSFNGMTQRLEATYRELHDLNRELHAKVAELTRTRRRLSEKQRLAAVGEAMSKISHEIQNKVGGAGVWVQNLERYGARDENTRLCVAELKAALKSFLEMLVHFKRFYRAPGLNVELVDAGALLDGCLARVAPELDVKELRLERDFPAGARLRADPAQLSDAIVNILLNAAHFSPSRGVLRAELESQDGRAVLRFRDQGPGLPPGARIFRPFFTTRPAGSGLGLAIVRNIVRAHGGRVRAYNNPAGGACFEIGLPQQNHIS